LEQKGWGIKGQVQEKAKAEKGMILRCTAASPCCGEAQTGLQ